MDIGHTALSERGFNRKILERHQSTRVPKGTRLGEIIAQGWTPTRGPVSRQSGELRVSNVSRKPRCWKQPRGVNNPFGLSQSFWVT